MEFRNSYVQQTCYIARAIPKCIVTDYLSVTYPKNYIDVTNLGKIGRVLLYDSNESHTEAIY